LKKQKKAKNKRSFIVNSYHLFGLFLLVIRFIPVKKKVFNQRPNQYWQSIANLRTKMMRRYSLDTQGEIPYAPAPKKGFIINKFLWREEELL